MIWIEEYSAMFRKLQIPGLMLILFSLSFTVFAQGEPASTVKGDSPFCPDISQLSDKQMEAFEIKLDLMIEYLVFLHKEKGLAVSPPSNAGQISILESYKDGAVCQKLNERFKDALNADRYYGSMYNRFYPAFQPAYFEFQGNYYVFLSYYVPKPPEGHTAVISNAPSIIAIFDDNLNKLEVIKN